MSPIRRVIYGRSLPRPVTRGPSRQGRETAPDPFFLGATRRRWNPGGDDLGGVRAPEGSGRSGPCRLAARHYEGRVAYGVRGAPDDWSDDTLTPPIQSSLNR